MAEARDEIMERIRREIDEFESTVKDTGLYHRGYRFLPPYACGRCGTAISARQFAFTRACGGCDVGNSQTARLSIYDHRWFLGGSAVLENVNDPYLIHPEFIPAERRGEFPILNAKPLRPLPKPRPLRRMP